VSRAAVRSFAAMADDARGIPTADPALPFNPPSDYGFGSTKRIAHYPATLARQFAPPVAILRILKLRIEVPVFDGGDELVLNRGVGWISGTARIGEPGNIGIAGHRDGFPREGIVRCQGG